VALKDELDRALAEDEREERLEARDDGVPAGAAVAAEAEKKRRGRNGLEAELVRDAAPVDLGPPVA